MKQHQVFTVVAFGDSITAAKEVAPNEQWTGVLEKSLAAAAPSRPTRVINAGVGGNTSREGLARMEADVIAHKPDLLLIEFGGNDATMDPNRFVPLDEFRANLATIVERAGKVGCRRFAIVTFPPVVDRDHTWGNHSHFKKQGGLDATVEKYRQASREFAAERGFPVAAIDKTLRADLPAYVMKDGVHLTAAGNRVVAETVLPVAVKMIG